MRIYNTNNLNDLPEYIWDFWSTCNKTEMILNGFPLFIDNIIITKNSDDISPDNLIKISPYAEYYINHKYLDNHIVITLHRFTYEEGDDIDYKNNVELIDLEPYRLSEYKSNYVNETIPLHITYLNELIVNETDDKVTLTNNKGDILYDKVSGHLYVNENIIIDITANYYTNHNNINDELIKWFNTRFKLTVLRITICYNDNFEI